MGAYAMVDDDYLDDRPSPPLPSSVIACRAPGCDREAAPGGYCHGHIKRIRRGQSLAKPLAPRYPTPWECLSEAALAYADADPGDDQAWERARHRLRMACNRYVKWRRSGGKEKD